MQGLAANRIVKKGAGYKKPNEFKYPRHLSLVAFYLLKLILVDKISFCPCKIDLR